MRYVLSQFMHLCICLMLWSMWYQHNPILDDAIINATDPNCNVIGQNQTHCYGTPECMETMCNLFIDAQPSILAIQVLNVINHCPNPDIVEKSPLAVGFFVLLLCNLISISVNICCLIRTRRPIIVMVTDRLISVSLYVISSIGLSFMNMDRDLMIAMLVIYGVCYTGFAMVNDKVKNNIWRSY